VKTPYLERIEQGALVYDGAMGTMLYARGVFVNRCFDEICLSNPRLVTDIHREYVRAGAEALETNSFGANRIKLASYGLEDKVALINRQAVRLAREAGGHEIYLAGAVGPLGARLEPFGRLTAAAAREAFREQIGALLEEGVDCLLLETFKNLDELVLACDVCRELSGSVPLQAQFTVGPDCLSEEGSDARRIAARLNERADVDVIGVNCSIGPADMLELLSRLREQVSKPLAVMPNAGLPREMEGRLFYLTSPEYFGEYALRFVEAGAAVIGGCCGTTPAHIAAMASSASARRVRRRRPAVEPAPPQTAPRQELPLAERSRLGNALARGEFVVSVELVPPTGTSLDRIIASGRALYRSGVTCINIPDGPRASSRISAMLTSLEIERRAKIETILHYCCRDRNLIGMQGDLLGAQAVGLRNLLIITGDPPKMGGYPEARGVFDVDALGLVSLARRLNQGIDLGGNALEEPTTFVIGVGANPGSLDPAREVERTFRKKEMGADFVITQPVFDVELLLDFLRKISDTGLPVLAGVWPLASYRNAQFLNNEVPEVDIPGWIMERMEKTASREEGAREGLRIAARIVREIRPAVRGIQISPPFGKVATALALLELIAEPEAAGGA
jgi:methionine synthase I (cobalamin-dependent)/5,10-methylenetetrahydrofolate reductase